MEAKSVERLGPVRIARSRTPPTCASPWQLCQQTCWQKGATMPAPWIGCQSESVLATARHSCWCRRPSKPPAQISSTRGRTSRRTKSSSAARLMDGGGGGAWWTTGFGGGFGSVSGWLDRASAWLELPDETSEAKERRMLLEAWVLWATVWTWAVVLRGALAPVWGRTSA